MRTRLSATVLVATALATLTAQSGQSSLDPQSSGPPQAPVFRVETNIIRVDMYATRNGQFVQDLRADEVEVLEDGVPQRIETFEHVHIARDGLGPIPAGARSEGLQEGGRNRVYVVFIDTHTTPLLNEPALRRSLVRFLDRLLGPDDLVGLMTPDMSSAELTLGRRSTVISDVANDERWIARNPDARPDLKEFGWESCYPSRGGGGRAGEMKARYRAKKTIDALQDLVGHLRDLREERKAVLLVTAGWPFSGETVLAGGGRGETDACRADRQALLKTDYGGLLRDLTRSANRANVSFYPVNSRRTPPDVQPGFRGGMAVVPAVVRQRQERVLGRLHEQLDALAQDTDGLAEKQADNLDRVTQRIIDDTSMYYLLGYQSTNPRADGRFRTITVRVKRPGVRVRARPGYGAEAPAALEVAAPGPAAPGPAAALAGDPRVSDALTAVEHFDGAAPVWLRSSPWLSSGPAEGGAFWFVGEVGAHVRGQPAWSSGLTADVEVLTGDRTQVLARSFALTPGQSAFSLRVPESGHLPSGEYAVRVRLTPVSGDDFTVHDVLRVTVGMEAEGPGPAVLWRRGPSPRLAYVETADPRFRRTERVRLELPTTSGSPVSARLLDRLGRPLQIPAQVGARPDPSGELEWISIDLPIAGLAPGDYTVEVTQDDVSQMTAFRMVP